MVRPQFTADSVHRLPYRPSSAGWCAYWHHKLAGFGLRVTAGGARAFIVRYRLLGTRAQRIRTLGDVEVLKFGEALERAREVLREAERGVDWFESIKRERAQTLGQVWGYYEREHLSTSAVAPRSRSNARILWRLHCERQFARAQLADITSEQVRDWHRRLSKARACNANRAAQMLRAAWNYGRKYGRVPRKLENPFAAVTFNRESAREVILEPHQFPAFAKAVNAIENPFARAYLWMLFYTGCRRTELLRLTWADVELLRERDGQMRSGTLLLRETKGGEPRRIVLSEPAVETLDGLPRTESQYVFCGSRAGAPLAPQRYWEQVRARAGLPQLRLHDLRRSFGSWLGASGVSPKLIGAALGHKTDITSRVYVQLGEASNIKRQLATAHAALAKQFAEEKPKADVVDLAKVRT